MKFIIVAAVALVAVASALPLVEDVAQEVAKQVAKQVVKQVAIIRSELNQTPEGPYTFSFESEDGVKREEAGTLKETLNEENKPTKVVVVRGTFSYINSDGQTETISYTADELGYHPEGPSIPVAPVPARR